MAKTRAPKKPVKEEPKTDSPKVLDPKDVNALFGVPGPYDNPEQPIPTKGFVTTWDCGMSINEMRRRKPDLFSSPGWMDGQAFAKLTDSWRFRQIDLTPSGLGEVFDPKTPDQPLARELVCYLVTHFLATGQRIEIGRLRCRDVMPSGRRVVVGPWRDAGLEICNVSDGWKSPDMGCCRLYTPLMPKKK